MMLTLGISFIIGIITVLRPRYGMVALIVIWPSYLLRTSIGGVPTTALELSVYAAAVAVGIRLLAKSLTWHWVDMTKTTWLLLALWTAGWVSATALAGDGPAALGAFKAWYVDPMLFIGLLAITIRTEQDRRLILNAAVASGAIVAVAGLVQFAFFRETLQEGRLSSFFAPVANYAAMYIGPLFVLTVGRLFHHRKVGLWIAAGVMGLALVLTLSFGAYLAVTAGVAILWWHQPAGRWKRSVALLGAAVVMLGVIGTTQTKNFWQHFDFNGRSSGSVRQQIWVTSWALVEQHPWFGVGPNNFETAYRAELPKHYFPPLEWLVAQPHNLYLALWLETGLLGLASFLLLFSYHVRLSVRQFLRDPVQRPVAVASVAAMVTILVHGLVDTPYFKNDLAMEFLFLATLPWLGRETDPNNAVPQKATNPLVSAG